MFNLILIFLAYLPFQLALNPAQGIDLASIRIIILAFFLVWLAKGMKDKKIVIKNNWITVLILFFLFLNLISVIASKNMDWSARKLLFLFSIFPIYFVASAVISNKDKMEKAIKFAILGGTAAALIGIGQFFLQFIIGLEKTRAIWANVIVWPFLGKIFGAAVLRNPSWLVNISGHTYLRATSVFPDPHMFSFFLGLLIPLSLGLAIKSKKPILFLSFLFLLFADMLTFSRGGYLGLLVGVLTMLFLVWHRIDRRYRAVILLIILLIFSSFLFPGPISRRLGSSFDLNEGSNRGRIEMWQKAGEIILEKPLLGTGIGNYPLEIKPSANYREPIYAHNTYLDIAVESGILTVLIWVGIIGSSLLVFLRNSKKEKMFLWLVIGLVIFSTHSFFETGLYSPVVLTLFLVLVSFSNIRIKNEEMV